MNVHTKCYIVWNNENKHLLTTETSFSDINYKNIKKDKWTWKESTILAQNSVHKTDVMGNSCIQIWNQDMRINL
jgi:hypothetical protein